MPRFWWIFAILNGRVCCLYFGRKVFVAGWIHWYSNYFGAHFKVELILPNKYCMSHFNGVSHCFKQWLTHGDHLWVHTRYQKSLVMLTVPFLQTSLWQQQHQYRGIKILPKNPKILTILWVDYIDHLNIFWRVVI